MTVTRLLGVVLLIADVVFIWWGLSATAGDFGSDYAAPGGRMLVILAGVPIALISLVLVVGLGRSRVAGE